MNVIKLSDMDFFFYLSSRLDSLLMQVFRDFLHAAYQQSAS